MPVRQRPDVDDADFRQALLERRRHASRHVRIERGERSVQHDPTRLLQENAGHCEALLVIVAQPPIPSLVLVEHGREVFETDDGERIADTRVGEGLRRMGIGERLAQRPGRDVAWRRHEDHRLAMRTRDVTAAPRPESRDRLEQRAFGVPVAGDEHVVARLNLQMGFAQGDASVGRRDPQFVDDDRFLVPPVQLDLALTFADLFDCHQHLAEARNAQERRPPVGDAGEIVGEPSQRLLHLVEGADDHHQFSEGHGAEEIRGRGDKDWRDDRQPTEARRHARQPGRRNDDLLEDLDDAAKDPIEALLLVGFAAVEGDALDFFVHAHEREAKLRLPRVTLRVQVDQRTADAPTQQRHDSRVEQRAPDHIARQDQGAPGDRDDHVVGQDPQHADEAQQQQGGLQQADAEIRRQFGQVPGVLMDALVWVFAEFADLRQADGSQRREPLGGEVFDETLAQNELRLQVEPRLRDVEDEQDAGQFAEHPELRDEMGNVLARQRVVERLVPGVQQNLRVCARADHRSQRDEQQRDLATLSRRPQRRRHADQLRGEAVFGWLAAVFGVRRRISRTRHSVASVRCALVAASLGRPLDLIQAGRTAPRDRADVIIRFGGQDK